MKIEDDEDWPEESRAYFGSVLHEDAQVAALCWRAWFDVDVTPYCGFVTPLGRSVLRRALRLLV